MNLLLRVWGIMDSEANDKEREEEIKSVNEDRGKSKPLELYNYANLDI